MTRTLTRILAVGMMVVCSVVVSCRKRARQEPNLVTFDKGPIRSIQLPYGLEVTTVETDVFPFEAMADNGRGTELEVLQVSPSGLLGISLSAGSLIVEPKETVVCDAGTFELEMIAEEEHVPPGFTAAEKSHWLVLMGNGNWSREQVVAMLQSIVLRD